MLWPSGGPEHCGDGRERELLSCGKGGESGYNACNAPGRARKISIRVMERLKEEAGRRAGIAQRKTIAGRGTEKAEKVGRDQG